MRHPELYSALHKSPFRPFRIQLTNGQSHDIPHPDFAFLTRSSIIVGLSSGDDDIPDEHIECDLLHIVALEPMNGAKRRNDRPRKKRPRG